MNSLGLINLVNLFALGGLLYLALTIMDSRRDDGASGTAREADPMRTMLGVIAGHLMVAGVVGALAALAGPMTVPLFIVAFIFGILAIRQFYRSERQVVLPYLAIAAERGIPLAIAARAYAMERADHFGRRVRQLAEVLEGGARLPAALRLSGHRLPIGSVLAVGLGDDFACLDATVRLAQQDEQRIQKTLRGVAERLAYLVWIATMTLGLHGYFSLGLAPNLDKIVDEFDLPRNPSLATLTLSLPFNMTLDVGDILWDFAIMPALCSVAVLGSFATIMMGEFWWRWLPGVGRLSISHDSSWVLRALGWGIKQGRSVEETLASIARHLPTGIVQRRVQRTADAARAGAAWTAALRTERLITEGDAALLEAAEEAGNLAWACEHSADSRLRQQEYRWQRGISFAFPLVILLAAADVFSLSGKTIRFLIDMMESLV